MQRDYILRMIEQAGAILRVILQRVLGGSTSANEISQDLSRVALMGGLDLSILRVCDAPGLLHIVAPGGELDPARTWLAAETLFVDATASQSVGNVEAAMVGYAKSASLFRLLEPSWVLPTGFPEATERVNEIEARLAGLENGDDAA